MTEPHAQASRSTVASLFAARAREGPNTVAIREGERVITYDALVGRVRRLVGLWRSRGVRAGDRVAVLSENRAEVLEIYLAAAWAGVIVAAQNWRLADPELRHCLSLVEPKVVHVSPRHAGRLEGVWRGDCFVLGDDLERALSRAERAGAPEPIDPESPLLIVYTSGTTGRPKGAVISHRAEIVRNLVTRAEYPLAPNDAFVAWAPMFHMGGGEYSLGTLMSGGEVIVVDGFDADAIATLVGERALGWLVLMPGMVSRLADALEARDVRPLGVKVCGVMPDLVPPAELARITRLLGAPYANTFGATETGNPPASAGLITVGEAPESLAKTQSAFCEVRLVEADGRDAAPGRPGELWMRGPTLFSGYWNAPDESAKCFAEGWFHMGDVFVRRPDGRLDFVDRVKYLIKSGGENVYPAEIERVLLAHPGVAEAAVVRRPDPRWGEVPVAFVARRSEAVGVDALLAACRRELAGYKQPKQILFIDFDDFPRSTSGKVLRDALERRLAEKGTDG